MRRQRWKDSWSLSDQRGNVRQQASTSHGSVGATEREARQCRAAGEEERDGREEFPYIL